MIFSFFVWTNISSGFTYSFTIQFLSTGENVDNLYALFSDLLDRKLKELNTTRDQAAVEAGDDIQDDYMREMTTGSNAVCYLFDISQEVVLKVQPSNF